MSSQFYVIALVRYESSKSWYSNLNAELKEIVFALEGYAYTDLAQAMRTRSRFVNSGTLPAWPMNREPLENGRYELYEWAVVLTDKQGNPGFFDNRSGALAYRRIEYPHLNDPEAKNRFIPRMERYGEDAPVWAFFVKKGAYMARLATWTGPEERQGHLGVGREARLLDSGRFQGDTLYLWKGKDY